MKYNYILSELYVCMFSDMCCDDCETEMLNSNVAITSSCKQLCLCPMVCTNDDKTSSTVQVEQQN
jgi:hypothetical protein